MRNRCKLAVRNNMIHKLLKLSDIPLCMENAPFYREDVILAGSSIQNMIDFAKALEHPQFKLTFDIRT